MIRQLPPQDPDAKLDYWFDLGPAITEQGSALASYSVVIEPGTDDALQVTGVTESGGVIYYWLSTPTESVEYTVRCRFTLANGYADDISRTIVGEQQ